MYGKMIADHAIEYVPGSLRGPDQRCPAGNFLFADSKFNRPSDELLEIVQALRASARFTGRLNRGQDQRDQDPDDGDDRQAVRRA